jgi:hypothetical protein
MEDCPWAAWRAGLAPKTRRPRRATGQHENGGRLVSQDRTTQVEPRREEREGFVENKAPGPNG